MAINTGLGNGNGSRFDHLREMAIESDIALFRRFTESDASDILGISAQTLRRLRGQGRIAYIQISDRHIQYFGWQILEYLWIQVEERSCPVTTTNETSKSVTIGSQNNIEAQPIAEHGSTEKPSKRDELRSAQRILKKLSKD